VGGGKGGQGGTVVLIAGTLFLGYLYFTRRLPGVITAIQSPDKQSGLASPTPGIIPPIGTPPIAPTGRASGYPRHFSLIVPTRNGGVSITVDAQDYDSCYQALYHQVMMATGSPILAAIYAQGYC